MQILDSSSSLRDFLLKIRGEKITLISAFAGGTENLVLNMLEGGNTIELVVGTINAFTSPTFIEFCASQKNPSLTAYIDFRYHLSTHWKIYLVSPNTVIIGSANFTDLGVSLQRDTCVVIRSDLLYLNYEKAFRHLKNLPEVLRANTNQQFQNAFTAYKLAHQRTQASLMRARPYATLEAWLTDESNQAIPLLVWTARHTDKDKAKAMQLLQQGSTEEESPSLRDYFTYGALKNDLPYSEGDIVLCCGVKGGHMDFYVFDKIIYKSGMHYIYSYRKRNLKPPFDLSPVRAKLKHLVASVSQDEQTVLTRASLANLASGSAASSH